MEDKDLKTAQQEQTADTTQAPTADTAQEPPKAMTAEPPKPTKPEEDSYNATLEEDTPQMTDEELQDSILEDSDLNGFQKWVARVSDEKWKLYQRILGIVLGLGAGVALFWDGITGQAANTEKQGMFSYSLIIAVVIALLVPNIVEKQGRRKIPVARTTMAITLGVVLVAYFIWAAARGGFGRA